jgi:hypothetical protein
VWEAPGSVVKGTRESLFGKPPTQSTIKISSADTSSTGAKAAMAGIVEDLIPAGSGVSGALRHTDTPIESGITGAVGGTLASGLGAAVGTATAPFFGPAAPLAPLAGKLLATKMGSDIGSDLGHSLAAKPATADDVYKNEPDPIEKFLKKIEFDKQRAEHPTLPDKTIDIIVKDHVERRSKDEDVCEAFLNKHCSVAEAASEVMAKKSPLPEESGKKGEFVATTQCTNQCSK